MVPSHLFCGIGRIDLRVLTPSHISGMDRIDLRVLTLRISAEWIIILMPAPMVPWYLFCGMDRFDLRVLTPSQSAEFVLYSILAYSDFAYLRMGHHFDACTDGALVFVLRDGSYRSGLHFFPQGTPIATKRTASGACLPPFPGKDVALRGTNRHNFT